MVHPEFSLASEASLFPNPVAQPAKTSGSGQTEANLLINCGGVWHGESESDNIR